MGQHDDYGKRLLRHVAGPAFEQHGPRLQVDYGAGRGGQIDGVVGGDIAVEVESRVAKQIRGAVLDLICHSYSKKLLIILPVHASNPTITAAQCRNIFSRFVPTDNFRVVVVTGSGNDERLSEDAVLVRGALQGLGFGGDA